MAELSGTFANYILRVRRYLNEEDPSKSRWTDPFLKQLFNTQYRKRCGELYMAHEGYFTMVATRDVIADQNRYAWPDGFQRLLKLEIVRSDGRRQPVQRAERHYHVLHTPHSGGDDWLPDYRPIGSGFVLEPASNQNISGGLHIEYTGVPEELDSDGDFLHSDFPTMLDEILTLDTVIVALDAEGLQETGQMHTILRQREEWQVRWERFIDGRTVSRSLVQQFVPAYNDA